MKNAVAEARRQRGWAFVRLALGLAQMMGAIAGIYLLVATGPSAMTIGTVLVTGVISGVSMWLRKVRKISDDKKR